MTMTDTIVSIRRITGNIGAEISGVKLSGDLPEETITQIRAAILAHKVVFFRGQGHIDDDVQVAFAGRLGTVTKAHPTDLSDRVVFDFDYSRTAARANSWHTDLTYIAQPPSFSILRSLVIPPVGGDTLWANTATGYASLPSELRDLADRLWALHSNEFDYGESYALLQDEDPGMVRRLGETAFRAIHPVVTVHPETSERAFLLGGFVRSIIGHGTSNTESLRRIFQEAITSPDNSVRWAWQVGDLAIWDNRATQHFAAADYGTEPRHVRRVTVVGQVPVSVTGERGRSVQGDASGFNRQA